MSRLFTCILAFALVTAQAQAVTHGGLKAAFDELDYTLNVAGAASREESRQAAADVFQDRIQALQEAGLTNGELISFTTSHIKNRALAAEASAAFASLQADRLTTAEARELVHGLVARSGAAGASWIGDAEPYFYLGFIILLTVAVAVWGVPGEGRESPCNDWEYFNNNSAVCGDSVY